MSIDEKVNELYIDFVGSDNSTKMKQQFAETDHRNTPVPNTPVDTLVITCCHVRGWFRISLLVHDVSTNYIHTCAARLERHDV